MCKLLELFVGLVFLVRQGMSTDVIYRLSDEEYARMPVKVHTDRYAHCLRQPGGVFCTARAEVVTDEPSELLDMMRAYSAHSTTHFNHTQLRYGMCMTRTCQEFYNGTGESELQGALEACINRTLSQGYGLKSRVTNMYCYFEDQTKNNKYSVDWVDWAVAALLFTIVALNVVGSVYDVGRDQTKPGNKFLLSFSWRRNWKQLMEPPSADPRAAELQSINGVRLLTCLIIVLIHILAPPMFWLEDAKTMEQMNDSASFYIWLNGHLTTSTFFLLSGFLLAYNTQISKKNLTWKLYVKSIILRYVRLSSIGVVAVTLTATLLRFSVYGPFWQEAVGIEVDDCRQYWIYNVLLIQNYVDFSTCALHTWSSAADFHLHIVGLTVMLLAPAAARRRAALAAIFLLGLLWPIYTVVSMDLDGTLLSRPEIANMDFDPTFHYLYKRTHNNIPVFIIGMTFGYIVFDLQRRKVTAQDHTGHRFLYWMLFPLMIVILQAGGFCFYQDGPRASLLLRALFTLTKPLFGLIVMALILGAVHKVETLYRGVLEWRGFVPLAKLSFCVYTLHIMLARFITGTRTTLTHSSGLHQLVEYFGSLAFILALALVVYLAVEAPVTQLSKMALADARPAVQQDKNKTE